MHLGLLGPRRVLLNQFAADSTGRRVVAGPVEATAIGNLLVQAVATGHISSISEGRAIVRQSFDLKTYDPGDQHAWDGAFERYLELKRKL